MNTDLDEDIDAMFIIPNRYLYGLYSRTINMHNNIELSKAIIYPNILIRIHSEIFMPFYSTIPPLERNQASFNIFVSTHGKHEVYKAKHPTTIKEFIENCNALEILIFFMQSSSYHSQSSAILGINYYTVSPEDHIRQTVPNKNFKDFYESLSATLLNTGTKNK